MMKTFRALVCFVLIAQLTGCGTLIHPERRGQKSGRIDPAIAILDGIGLLFFIIPGLIAFAIDFSTGTIYLPGTARLAKFDPKRATAATLEGIVQKETGYRVKLNQADMQVSRLESLEDMGKRFAEIAPGERNIRVALNTK